MSAQSSGKPEILKRDAIIYGRIKQKNKDFLEKKAKEAKVSIAVWLDAHLDSVRNG